MTNFKFAYQTQSATYSLTSILLQIAEILLSFRLIFKFLGANPQSGLVRAVYAITHLLVTPFANIFPVSPGSTDAILEPGTLIALVIYPVLVWEINQIVTISSRRSHQRAVSQ